MSAVSSVPYTVTLNSFQGLTSATALKSKILKQVQHDEVGEAVEGQRDLSALMLSRGAVEQILMAQRLLTAPTPTSPLKGMGLGMPA